MVHGKPPPVWMVFLNVTEKRREAQVDIHPPWREGASLFLRYPAAGDVQGSSPRLTV